MALSAYHMHKVVSTQHTCIQRALHQGASLFNMGAIADPAQAGCAYRNADLELRKAGLVVVLTAWDLPWARQNSTSRRRKPERPQLINPWFHGCWLPLSQPAQEYEGPNLEDLDDDFKEPA